MQASCHRQSFRIKVLYLGSYNGRPRIASDTTRNEQRSVMNKVEWRKGQKENVQEQGKVKNLTCIIQKGSRDSCLSQAGFAVQVKLAVSSCWFPSVPTSCLHGDLEMSLPIPQGQALPSPLSSGPNLGHLSLAGGRHTPNRGYSGKLFRFSIRGLLKAIFFLPPEPFLASASSHVFEVPPIKL